MRRKKNEFSFYRGDNEKGCCCLASVFISSCLESLEYRVVLESYKYAFVRIEYEYRAGTNYRTTTVVLLPTLHFVCNVGSIRLSVFSFLLDYVY